MNAPRQATALDEARSIDLLTLAFSADPVARWTWSDPQRYLAHFPAFARAFGGGAFAAGGAFLTESGAALWLPPGVRPDEEALVELVERTAPERIRADVFSLLEHMERYHPAEPHWYLPLIGVDPARQRSGEGSALMRAALAACDREQGLAYLESTGPKNVPLYERCGFELLGIIEAGESPPLFPMLRRRRGGS